MPAFSRARPGEQAKSGQWRGRQVTPLEVTSSLPVPRAAIAGQEQHEPQGGQDQQYGKAAGAVTARRGMVCCRACRAWVAVGRHSIESNRAPLCLACLAVLPDAPFAERLKAHRLAAGLTQTELAGRSGVAEGSISMNERGQVTPGAASLARLVRVLGPGLG
jgi:DNA-binding XRE family transcriptional regulator